MNDLSKKYFTISEMVSASNTTKDTLYFYERKGLLKPKFVDDNGYRYYDLENFYRLDMILTLRESKSSIKEIAEFLDTVSPEEYIQYMRTRITYFQEKQREYQILENRIQNSILQTNLGMAKRNNDISIEEEPKEYLITHPVSNLNDDNTIITAFSAIKKLCTEHHIPVDFHLSAIVEHENLINGNLDSGLLYAKAYKKISGDYIHVKPAGPYLTTIHKGDYNNLHATYDKLFDYAKAHNFEIIGNSYEQTLIGWFNCNQREQYITKVSIQIE